MKLALKYRPMDVSKRYKIRYRLETGNKESYNWRSRVRWYPAGWKINNQTLGRLFSRLHYLGCHAPEPVQKKWKNAYSVFHDKHFGSDKASMRYLSNWSCHNWL